MQWNDPATMAYSLKQLPVKHKKMQWNDSATIAYTRKQNLESVACILEHNLHWQEQG